MRKLLFYFILSFTIAGQAAAKQEAAYFQQEVNTTIRVTLDDISHVLRGAVKHEYINNSPDTLHFIYFHIYPNAYKDNTTAYAKQMQHHGSTAFMKTTAEERGFIDSLSFKMDGLQASIQATKDMDVIRVILPRPLAPGGSCRITTPFRVKIPVMTSRLGHAGQSYQVSQWFPKPAVYDRNGWHQFPYLNLGEYYSEFGTYTVDITLPDNYIVMATGNLRNAREEKWLDSLSNLPYDAFPSKGDGVASSARMKTLRFEESRVHDFAWFADKKWIVRKEVFTLPENNHEVTAYACFYKDDTSYARRSVLFIKEAILGYSRYAGPYPYKTAKSVTGALNAGGGMEYPTITIIDAFKDEQLIKQVIVHEVGHNWFYGILGNNERRYPFMDESINSYYEKLVVDDINAKYGLSDTVSGIMSTLEQLTVSIAGSANKLAPVCLHSAGYKSINYSLDIYEKGAQYFSWLSHYMGPDTFHKAIRSYFEQWQFRHPQPEDLQKVLQSHTQKPIGWFFESAITRPGMPDFSVSSKSSILAGDRITIRNRTGSLHVPAGIRLINGADSSGVLWTPPFRRKYTLSLNNASPYSSALLDRTTPDQNTSNNSSKKQLRIRPLFGLNNKPGYSIYISPAIGGNVYDGLMLGGLLHNITLPGKKLEYAIAPMYGFQSGQFVYTGYASYFWPLNNTAFRDITFTLNSKKFSDGFYPALMGQSVQYLKNKLGVTFNFKPADYGSYDQHSLTAAIYDISRNSIGYSVDSNSHVDIHKNGYKHQQYYTLTYAWNNHRPFNPYSLKLYAQAGQSFGLLSADARYKVSYKAGKKGISIRAFAGQLLGNNIPLNGLMSITHSGWNDYLYDHTFIGRNEQTGFWSNQSVLNSGGFYTQTRLLSEQVGITGNFLGALNIDIQVPKTPFSIFGNLAYTGKSKYTFSNYNAVQYEAGIAFHLADYITIALPIVLSEDLNNYRKYYLGKNRVLKSVAFRLNLSELFPSRNMLNTIFK